MQSEEVSRTDKCRKYCRVSATFLFSHIGLCGLVVGYCIMGAFTFEALEHQYETDKRREVVSKRENVLRELKQFNQELLVFAHANWSTKVAKLLNKFESEIVHAMRIEGFDGNEEGEKQWSFSGALFYSIIVITTIGYGNVAPKTTWGKLVTILYAIVGIPLMLLCLSNIGDVMAQSFKFLYWRACCFLCRPPRKRRTRSFRHALHRYPSTRSRPGSFKRQYSFKDSSQGGDSLSRSSYYSAPNPNIEDIKFYEHDSSFNRKTAVSPPSNAMPSLPLNNLSPPDQVRRHQQQFPVIFNKYVLKQGEDLVVDLEPIDRKRDGSTRSWNSDRQRAASRGHEAAGSVEIEDEYEQDSSNTVDGDENMVGNVPTWLCLFVVFLYICGGGALFMFWEKWNFLDSTYFCFVTLTTIGFGDLVPGKAVKTKDANLTLGLCSLYLWFGMALLAMSFNLLKGEVTKSIKTIAIRIGILPEDTEVED